MKKLIFILPLLMLLSCNHSSGSGDKSVTAKSDAASGSTTSAEGKGTITCTIDGKSKTFQVHNGFFEIVMDPDSKGPKDGLELLDGSATNEGFQFEIKNKGTSVFKGMDGVLNMFSYFNGKGVDYVTYENATASVSSFDGNHLTGTFSGKFQNTNYKSASDSNPEFIQITDGKFDLN
ncbi:MAG: hypothetical protein M3R50_03420 [Bacteroidota bacterium]|nr:hypothetical protein [Bacteroidota bacterium]